jgi:hypothetical protein
MSHRIFLSRFRSALRVNRLGTPHPANKGKTTEMSTNKKLYALAAAAVLATPMASFAAPISFGALSSDDSGSTQIIHDSLNNYDWLRWDTLTLSYADTLAATSTGGQYEGWQFAYANEAQLFTNALLQGLTNDCTVTGDDTCNQALPSNLTPLFGDPPGGGTSERINFLANGGSGGSAGYMQYYHEGDFGSVYKSNEGSSLEDGGWLLYRTAGTEVPPTSVPEPGTIALFGAAFAAMGFMRRRQVA